MPDWPGSLEVDGRLRTYTCHVPPGLSTDRRPLLIVLHGRRSTVSEMRWMTHFDAVADEHGFVIVYPEGHRRSWNDGRGHTPAARDGVDDVGFIRRMIDSLAGGPAGIDPDRVAATGLSNGGTMCHRLALELGDRIAAIAPVAGLMPVALSGALPAYAVAVSIIHGTADPFAPFGGGHTVRGRLLSLLLNRGWTRKSDVLSVADTAAWWRAVNGCTAAAHDWLPAAGRDRTRVEHVSSTGGRAGTAVDCWIVHGGGHTWPGGPRLLSLGRTTTVIDAGQVIWRFVASHFQPGAARCLPGR